jgi:hypothetical protein
MCAGTQRKRTAHVLVVFADAAAGRVRREAPAGSAAMILFYICFVMPVAAALVSAYYDLGPTIPVFLILGVNLYLLR